MATIADIDFGYATAEQEAALAPQLLLGGFFDLNHSVQTLTNEKFLCLGPKGSGKSAFGEHVRLMHEADPQAFVTRHFLGDFPFAGLKKLAEVYAGDGSLQVAWSWLLNLIALESLREDNGVEVDDVNNFSSALRMLEKHGLIPSATIREKVIRSGETTIKASLIPGLLDLGGKRAKSIGELDLAYANDFLRGLVEGVRTSSKHIVILDGLDDLIPHGSFDWESLGALMINAFRFNSAHINGDHPVKLIVLCRTDIFERLPGANMNKARQDGAVHLRWVDDSSSENSEIFKLINKKAQVNVPDVDNVIAEFLPASISVKNRQVPIYRYLLNNTRHLPRDILQLLKTIQNEAGDSRVASESNVRRGLKRFSFDYFYPEILDGLDGHIEHDQGRLGLELVALYGKPTARIDALEDLKDANAHFAALDVNRFFEALYNLGGAGNQRLLGKNMYYAFRYRDPHVVFNRGQSIRIHPALYAALNIPA